MKKYWPQERSSEYPIIKQEILKCEKEKKKRHFKVKDWASDQETIKRPKKKKCAEDYRAETDTEPAKRQSVGIKIKNILMDKRRKGFMVRESSENRKRDKCKPAWVETEFCWSNISFDFLFPFFPAQPGSMQMRSPWQEAVVAQDNRPTGHRWTREREDTAPNRSLVFLLVFCLLPPNCC